MAIVKADQSEGLTGNVPRVQCELGEQCRPARTKIPNRRSSMLEAAIAPSAFPAPTRSQGLTVRSKTTGGRTSPIHPLRLNT